MSYNPNARQMTPQEQYNLNLFNELEEKRYTVGLTPQEEQQWWALYAVVPKQ
jgi:hypothetical protein